MTNTKLLRSRVMGNYHARFWSRVGRGDLSYLGNYHLKLRCYVVIELKSGKFKPEYTGKLNFYLSAVDDILKHKDDKPSIGILLCRDKGEQIKAEYALRDINKPIGLAEYNISKELPKDIQTSLPSIEKIEAELSQLTPEKSK